MKPNYLFTLFLLLAFFPSLLLAQIKMGTNPTQIEPYALFEMESQTAGLLIPRMSSQQRDAAFLDDIPNGLMIFNRDTQCVEVYLKTLQTWSCVGPQIFQRLDNELYFGKQKIDVSDLLDNTDAQQLSIEQDTLRLENGGQIDLSPYKQDAQPTTITHFSLTNGMLELALSNSTQQIQQVDLTPLVPIPQIDLFGLQSGTLRLSLATDGVPPLTVDFSSLLQQQTPRLQIENHQLQLGTQTPIDLSAYLDNSDGQQLGLSVTSSHSFVLQLTNSQALQFDLEPPFSVSSNSGNILTLQSPESPFKSTQNITHNSSPTWGTHHFVFGSPSLDNLSHTKADNKRLFFNKSKGAFRAGIAESDQWDDKNIGTYSVALGRNTIAGGYHATALGSKTEAQGWYTTALGVGTIALSRAETAFGSYNTTYNPKGNTNKWEVTDRLLVVGNGTGSSTASRSDALVMLKNGNTTVSGNWSGPAFVNTSDRNLKTNIEDLALPQNLLEKLQPKQYRLLTEKTDRLHFGLLADELAALLPHLVYTNAKGQQAINYIELIPVLIRQLQQQQKQIKALEEKLKYVGGL